MSADGAGNGHRQSDETRLLAATGPPRTTHVSRALRLQIAALVLLLVLGVAVVAAHRPLLGELLSYTVLRAGVAVLILLIGWFVVRRLVQLTTREVARRSDPRTASSLVFLVKLAAVISIVAAELYVVGTKLETLFVSGAVLAVVLALASQQLLGNIFAGGMLLASGIVVIGQHVRLQGGSIAGQVEGVVTSFGLFHVTLKQDEGGVMLIPNLVFQQLVIIPDRTYVSGRN